MHRHSEIRITLCIAAYVVALMTICVNSSPLLNMTYTDSSVFVAMARAMLKGKIAYKDVFDHKGLYLYFLNCLAVMMTGKSLLGLFVIECVFMTVCARIIYTMLSENMSSIQAFIGMQIFMMLAIQGSVLEGGNLTEEYALMFQVLAIYLVFRDKGRHSSKLMMMQGVLAALTLCLRPNMIMMWGGIAIVSGIDMLMRREFKKLVMNIVAGFAGLVIALIPAVIYAAVNDSVNDTLFGMFTYNFVYTNIGAGVGLILRRTVRVMLRMDKFLTICLILSMMIMHVKGLRDLRSAYYWAMLLFSAVSVGLSGRTYGHYYEYLVPFCIPLCAVSASRVTQAKYKHVIVTLLIITVLFGARAIPDRLRVMLGKTVLPEKDFIKCNEPYYSENEKVLATGINVRLYNILGVTPHMKYFYVPASDYEVFPEPVDSQVASIISGENDVIFIKYVDDTRTVYPESGKAQEIMATLAAKYDLLHYDEASNTAMYGRKR